MSWEVLGLLLLAGLLEFIISFFFNYKIYWITKENYLFAGIYGATATFLYMIMSGAVVYVSAIEENFILLIFSAILIAVGNFASTIAIKHFQAFLANRKARKENTLKLKEEQTEEKSYHRFMVDEHEVIESSEIIYLHQGGKFPLENREPKIDFSKIELEAHNDVYIH